MSLKAEKQIEGLGVFLLKLGILTLNEYMAWQKELI